MRIATKVFSVGGIPIVIAAGIAIAAVVLSNEADHARSGAVLAGTVYRNLMATVTARNDYLNAEPSARAENERRFRGVAAEARHDLARLHGIGGTTDRHATDDADQTLARYVENMDTLAAITARNDGLVADMASRAASLIRLADQARKRQHDSNADVMTSLTDGDRKLRAARDVVDAAYNLRMAVAATASEQLDLRSKTDPAARNSTLRRLGFDLVRLRNLTSDLLALLHQSAVSVAGAAVDGLGETYYQQLLVAKPNSGTDPAHAEWDGATQDAVNGLAKWSERILKLNSIEYRSLHDVAAQLFGYSVQAQETEQATQNIAIEILKLGNRSAEALMHRDQSATQAIVEASRKFPDTIAGLPISPLIQAEMIEAFRRWHEGLQTTTEGLARQSTLVASMDEAAARMIEAARSLDATYTGSAESISNAVRTVLILGAAIGLLLGSGAATFAARSITIPLKQLQMSMNEIAAGMNADLGAYHKRKDELGDMARATHVFLTEIARRERAIRQAKEQADGALKSLRQTQAELIQAEKLASLGQLVAGVAHEINTPLGIAYTTSTVLDEEVARFRLTMREGKVSRAALERLIERTAEGAGLLTTNLSRAADLVQAFKHVAVDQVSGERRSFDVGKWLQELITSLGPMLRKSSHEVITRCPPDLMLDSFPGALAQVVTNLIVNANLHAFPKGVAGRITIVVEQTPKHNLLLSVGDNGRGVTADQQMKMFDPFYTTRRSEGSTGLGLHIVYNLITNTLRGRVDLESAPGKGCRFLIELPQFLPASVQKHLSETEAMT